MDVDGTSALAPVTQLGREARIHITYRRMAKKHQDDGGQITPDVHDDLMTKAELHVPALRVVKNTPATHQTAPLSLFHPTMVQNDVHTPNSVKSPENDAPRVEPELTVLKPEIVDVTAALNCDRECMPTTYRKLAALWAVERMEAA